ncbi:MAG: YciI family protein [Chloroflexi bacterium]|nr:MAG: YciI family protein [Chloroflexota bacterium]
MRYIALIYNEENGTGELNEAEWAEMMTKYNAFSAEARAAGVTAGGEALQPTHTATTVRVRDGNIQTMDGPFAETKEVLGGYYILDCANLDDAIHWAAKIPGARHGSVEVRPLVEF